MSLSANLAESLGKLGVSPMIGDTTRGEHAGVDGWRLANGAMIGWRCPDDTGERESHVAASLIRVAAEAAQRIASIDADTTRTDSWKAEQRAKIASEAQARFDDARGHADKIATDFAAADAREAAPAPLAAGDHAAALVDHECRAWLRSLDPEALVALGKELTEPKHARLLEAMMRSPVPLPPWIAESARAAWIEHRLRADPQGARLRRQARERVEWLGTVTDQVAQAVADLRPKSTSPSVTRTT